MATISTFQPAQTQTNQEYFQLPFNEMYKVLSDTQTRSDINRGEAEAITEESFSNLPQDEAHAAEARKWLMDSVDGLTENYGEDPLKWTAGLQSLKKQVKRRFDPSFGDIGKMQKRYERVVSMGADYDERYKEYPELARYFKNSIIVDPFESSNSKVDYGVKPAMEVRNVAEKEINDFFTSNMAQLEEKTLQHYGIAKYGSLNAYTDAWIKGDVTGIEPDKIMSYLYSLTPEEYYNSYYQKAKAFGDPNAEAELNPFEYGEDGKVNYENGMMGLNPESTIAQKIFGYMTGKSYTKENYETFTVEDATIRDAISARAKAAEVDMKKQFFGYQTTGLAYQAKSPWGTTEGSVNNYIATSKANNDAIAKDLLLKTGLSDIIVAQIDADGLYNGEVVSVNENGTPNIKVQGKTGEHLITGMTLQAYNDFKNKYDTNWYGQTMAERSLLEAKVVAEKEVLNIYGKDYNTLLQDLQKEVTPVEGYSFTDVLDAIDAFDAVRIVGSKGGPRYYRGDTEISTEEYRAIADEYSYLRDKTSISKYKKVGDKVKTAIRTYDNTIENNLAPNTKYSSVYTNDLGLDPAGQEVAKKELTDMFQFGNAANFKAYSPNVAEQLTVSIALKKAAEAAGFGKDAAFKTDLAGFSKSITPTPEGLYHWQLNYTITGTGDNKSTKSVSVLVPMSEVEGGLSSPVLESIKSSPYARAANVSTLAKIFDFQEFTPPDLPGIKILHSSNSDLVQINGVTMSMEEGVGLIATEYAIKDIMRIYNQDYDTAVITYRELNKPEAVFNTGVGPTIPVTSATQQ